MLTIPPSLNCRGRLLSLHEPRVMAILNLTPDSFYDGGRYGAVDAAVERATAHLANGASILDLGGASSRPGAREVSESEELERVLPVVGALLREHPDAIVSIDTYRASVAEACLDAGASMINDISAGKLDPALWQVVARHRVPYVLMHMQGTPRTMQRAPSYGDVFLDVYDELNVGLAELRALGLHDVVIDPGFGFGKTVSHNYELLARFADFRALGAPLLAGLSRKSMVCRPLGCEPAEALNGTTALNILALERGANLLRVHDVAEAMQVIRLYEQLRAVDAKATPFASLA